MLGEEAEPDWVQFQCVVFVHGVLLRVDVECFLDSPLQTVTFEKKTKPLRENLSRDEKKALKSLREDENIVVAQADKGNVTVVLNKLDYEKKVSDILQAAPF